MEMTTATKNRPQSKTRDMVYIAFFSIIIAVGSWISIPMAVPFTLQTFAVFIAVGILGGRRGTLAVLLYILLGAVGIPVFAGFKGGVGALVGNYWGVYRGISSDCIGYVGNGESSGEILEDSNSVYDC